MFVSSITPLATKSCRKIFERVSAATIWISLVSEKELDFDHDYCIGCAVTYLKTGPDKSLFKISIKHFYFQPFFAFSRTIQESTIDIFLVNRTIDVSQV